MYRAAPMVSLFCTLHILCALQAEEFTFSKEVLVGPGLRPGVAVDAQGNVHVAYTTGSKICYNKYANGSLSRRETVANLKAWWPQVKVSSDGDVHVLWEDSPKLNDLTYARRINGQWTLLELWNESRIMLPRLAIDSKNKAHAAMWLASNEETKDGERVEYYRIAKSGNVLKVELTNRAKGNAANRTGDIIVDAQNKMHLFMGRRGAMLHWTLNSNDVWSREPDLKIPHCSESTSAAILRDGTIVAVTSPGEPVGVLWFTSTVGKNGILARSDMNFAQMAADTQRNIAYVVATVDGRAKLRAFDIYTKAFTIAGPVDIAQGNGVQKQKQGGREGPSIVAAPQGGVWVAYQDDRSGSNQVYIRYARLADGGDGGPNQRPQVKIGTSMTSAAVGEEIRFDGSGSVDSDGSILRHEWDFGDGNTKLGVQASHAWSALGTYNVKLTVTDNDGATSWGWVQINISRADKAPPQVGLTAVIISGTVDDPTLATVLVEGKLVRVVSNSFRSEVLININPTTVEVTATDAMGHATTRVLHVIP